MKPDKIEIFGKRFPVNAEAIVITGKKIKSIPDLGAFKKLKRLDLSRNEITKIKGLNSLNRLEELNLDNNSITKIENLSGLLNLETLSLCNNEIGTIENLEKLENLESLQLSSNKIKTISGLSTLKALRFLYLINNQIEKIEQFENLNNLEELFLGENKITAVEGLHRCKKLWKIYLNDNQIANLSFDSLPATTNILNLSGNAISEIHEPKTALNQLNTISMRGNPLNTLKYIERLPSIESISIEGKKCKAISLKTYIHIKEKQGSETDENNFCFFTSNTTTRRDIDEFITSQHIKVVD